MKYCQYCGTQLVDFAKFCSNCGHAIDVPNHAEEVQLKTILSNSNQKLINTLSSRLKTNSIIWLIISFVQITIGVLGAWFTLLVGILNLLSAIIDIKHSRRILVNQNGIVKMHEPITVAIITLAYNVVIGGLIGVLGSIYYLVFVRGFVMENKDQFLKMETDEPLQNNPNPQKDDRTYVEIVLTKQEALTGTQKEFFLEGLQIPQKISIPPKTQQGDSIILRNIKIKDKDGKETKKDICLRISIQN